MSQYKKAKCIELHDSHIALTTSLESYCGTSLTGRTEFAERRAYTIRYCDVKMLADMFKIRTEERVNLSKMTEQSFVCDGKYGDTESMEFPIYKFHQDCESAEGNEIINLECEVVSDRMVNIRVTSKLKDDTGAVPYFENITYSGSFTVWWASGNQS